MDGSRSCVTVRNKLSFHKESGVLADSICPTPGTRRDVLRTANERKEHIPPVVSGGVVSFPFDIALPPERLTQDPTPRAPLSAAEATEVNQ